jgi:hypothetical protein
MYCEGFWKVGVCIADMGFCGEPTADGDIAAGYMRVWYEANRETWSERHFPFGENRKNGSALADEFILGMMQEVARINGERERQIKNIKR